MESAGPRVSLDTLILIVLSTANLFFTPFVSALVITCVAIYAAISWLFPLPNEPVTALRRLDRFLFLARLAIVLFIICLATVLPTALNIVQRREEGPATHAHDGLVQTEVSIQY